VVTDLATDHRGVRARVRELVVEPFTPGQAAPVE
jgi:hypothetical protein